VRLISNTLKALEAYFRGAVLDRYRMLDKRGEAHRLYLFQGSGGQGDVHGGGGYGGWGRHGRMRIYEELVRENMLTKEEQALIGNIVIQSLSHSRLCLFRRDICRLSGNFRNEKDMIQRQFEAIQINLGILTFGCVAQCAQNTRELLQEDNRAWERLGAK